MSLIRFTKKGLYCPPADFYIDPWRKVDKALVTHGHSDHARKGMKQYLCAKDSVPILRSRLGRIRVSGLPYGETTTVNGVKVSFHPAGHILGSSQIRLEYKGEVWVVSGDYKTLDDGVSGSFEPIPCHHFITETTFGLPVYRWRSQDVIFDEIHQWWTENIRDKRPSILHAYSLGKAQRILKHLDKSTGSILIHPAIANMNGAYRLAGQSIGEFKDVHDADKEDKDSGLFLTPSSGVGASWTKGLKNASTAFASGWMRVRGARRRRNMERGFVLSDHADWPGLNMAIEATGAEHIYATHGYTSNMKQWVDHLGKRGHIVSTEYGEEDG